MILLALCLCGLVFWITGSRQRRETDEAERNSLILDEQ
jgi:cbb3-type cytochrome oxidase subunit 3